MGKPNGHANGNGNHGNGAGLVPASPVSEPLTTLDPPFEPSLRQLQYLEAVEDILETDGRLSQAAIARRLEVSKQAVNEVFQNPRFSAWLKDQIDLGNEDRWPLIKRRMVNLALRGSIQHMALYARVKGAIRDPGFSSTLHASKTVEPDGTQHTSLTIEVDQAE